MNNLIDELNWEQEELDWDICCDNCDKWSCNIIEWLEKSFCSFECFNDFVERQGIYHIEEFQAERQKEIDELGNDINMAGDEAIKISKHNNWKRKTGKRWKRWSHRCPYVIR